MISGVQAADIGVICPYRSGNMGFRVAFFGLGLLFFLDRFVRGLGLSRLFEQGADSGGGAAAQGLQLFRRGGSYS
jgi:hypothetical protein